MEVQTQNTPTVNKFNANLQAIEYADVRGNKLLYLKIQANGKEVLVNIGVKTYDSVTELLKPRETSTTINVLPAEKK